MHRLSFNAPPPLPPHAGGAFELVSCPHYLAEILIYCGLLAAAGAREPAGWLMLAWVVSTRPASPPASQPGANGSRRPPIQP